MDAPALDIVTVTCNRQPELLEQAKRIGPQMAEFDRWIVVDDASDRGIDARQLAAAMGHVDQLLIVPLCYAKGEAIGTVNRARHVGCSLARNESLIVEIDDHDWLEPDALQLVRDAAMAGGNVIYGDCHWYTADGQPGEVYRKPEYTAWMLRDGGTPCEGLRAFWGWLYRVVQGYRWCGEFEPGGNEFPAGDYGLQLRMEAVLEGTGFVRIPRVLCRSVKVVGGISTRFIDRQADMAKRLRRAAQDGSLKEL